MLSNPTITNTPLQVTTLESLANEFRQWRSQPDRTRFIPKGFWDKVVYLLKQPQYSRAEVLGKLGISTNQLKAKLAKQDQAVSKSEVAPDKKQLKQALRIEKDTGPHFVKATLKEKAPMNNVATHHDVLITKSNGASLQITQLSYADTLLLAKQFYE